MSYIAVIGAGSWGTTLAHLLSSKGFEIALWVYEKDLSEEIRQTRVNSVYLPDIELPDNIRVTGSLEEALEKLRKALEKI